MTIVTLTQRLRTGDVLESFQRHILRSAELSDWAEELLMAGVDNDDVVFAAANRDLYWQQVNSRFVAICRHLGLSDDIENEIAAVKRRVMIEEFRHGRRTGCELLHKFDDLRKEVGYPEMVILRLLEDNDDDTNASGYYSINPGDGRKRSILRRFFRGPARRLASGNGAREITGDELESLVCGYLARSGIQRQR